MGIEQLIEIGKDICAIVGAITISTGIIYCGVKFKERINTYKGVKELMAEDRLYTTIKIKPTIFNAGRIMEEHLDNKFSRFAEEVYNSLKG